MESALSQTSNDNHSHPVLMRIKAILSAAEDFGDLLPSIFKAISDNLDAQWIGYWAIDKETPCLKLSQSWHSAETNADAFDEDVRRRILAAGEGMPGLAWRMRKPLRSADLMKDMMLPKSLKAHAAGLNSGFWFPVYSNGNVYGVFEVLKVTSAPVGDGVLQVLDVAGKEMGRYIATLTT